MKTLTIELYHDSARKLIKDLEDLKILKVVKTELKKKKDIASRFSGKLSVKTANELHTYVAKSRKEWS